MKRIKTMSKVALMMALVTAAGCCCFQKSDYSAWQGKWKGYEVGGATPGSSYLTVTGQSLDFRGADTNEWDKGFLTFLPKSNPRRADIQITDCPEVQAIGKTCHAIYALEGGTLNIAAYAPGDPNTPMTFDAAGARHFIFKKEP